MTFLTYHWSEGTCLKDFFAKEVEVVELTEVEINQRITAPVIVCQQMNLNQDHSWLSL